jgi:hypothetical protein
MMRKHPAIFRWLTSGPAVLASLWSYTSIDDLPLDVRAVAECVTNELRSTEGVKSIRLNEDRDSDGRYAVVRYGFVERGNRFARVAFETFRQLAAPSNPALFRAGRFRGLAAIISL